MKEIHYWIGPVQEKRFENSNFYREYFSLSKQLKEHRIGVD